MVWSRYGLLLVLCHLDDLGQTLCQLLTVKELTLGWAFGPGMTWFRELKQGRVCRSGATR